MSIESLNKYKCSKCGCSGLHACTGYPITWTENDKKRLEKALAEIFKWKNKK